VPLITTAPCPIETENDLRLAESPDHRDQSYQPAIIQDCRSILLFAKIGKAFLLLICQ
jgi:hypothetical protein